jgi:tetraacyldisaccharide 4'-kinase
MSLDTSLQKLWYGPAWRSFWLWPLSVLFAVVAGTRRLFFRCGVLKQHRVAEPVIVVGNLTVGGTGKTPLVIWLVRRLQSRGVCVGVITRGYGGRATRWPQRVTADSDPAQMGDEAVLLAQQTGAIVCAGPDRVAAANMAIAAGAKVVLSDDGLQHYRLARDLELVVIDASRGVGNGLLLPAGPLREPLSRLRHADMVLFNCRNELQPVQLDLPTGLPTLKYAVKLTGLHAVNGDGERALESLRGQTVHVVTGIGNPAAFIEGLRQAGLTPLPCVLPDHARFTADDIRFADDLPVLMTGKDAVKCRAFADARHEWVMADIQMDARDAELLLQRCNGAISRRAQS